MTKPQILLIHTGGTIGMVRSGDGFAPQRGVVEGEVERLTRAGVVTAAVTIAPLEPLIDSANATPEDWNRITDTIMTHYADFDGFVVTHGTDTLAHSAAALTMALEGIAKPIVLTGAMLPLSVPENDGTRNLSDAFTTAQSAAPGVWVQFAGRVLHGGRLRKTHSTSYDAFAAVAADAPPLRTGADGPVRHVYGRPDVAILPVAPGGAGNMLCHAAETCDGIVLRCFGSGTVPNTPRMRAALEKAEARGIPVLAVSQCPEGGMALGTYAAGAILTRHKAVDGRDMTMEAAYVKMILALSAGRDITALRGFLAAPLCGELSRPAP